MKKCKLYHTGVRVVDDGVIHNGLVYLVGKNNKLYPPKEMFMAKEECEGGLIQFEVNDKWGFADITTGEIVIQPEWDYAGPFYRGFAHVMMGGKVEYISHGPESDVYYSKHGYIDTIGNVIIPLDYDYALDIPFSNNFIVKEKDNYGIVDVNNNVIIPIIYDSIVTGYEEELIYSSIRYNCKDCDDRDLRIGTGRFKSYRGNNCTCIYKWAVYNNLGVNLIAPVLNEEPFYFEISEDKFKGYKTDKYLVLRIDNKYGYIDINQEKISKIDLSKNELDKLLMPDVLKEAKQDYRRMRMFRKDCNSEVLELIKDEYNQRTGLNNSRLRLPSNMTFNKTEDTVYIHIEKDSLNDNMQTPSGSFDSWAVAIKNWAKDINYIILSWDEPEDINNPHFQRFLYRVMKSIEVFKWLKVGYNERDFLDGLKIKEDEIYFLSAPKSEVQIDAKGEAKLEREFVNIYKEELIKSSDIDNDNIYSQLPLGVFHTQVANNNEIFPAKGAQIDLWGINNKSKEFHLFELKKPDAKMIGIYSQLFFYTMVMQDFMKGKFIYNSKQNLDFRGLNKLVNNEFNSIKGHFLATKLYPLIDEGYIKIINEGFKSSGKNIEFDFLKYSLDYAENISIKKEF